ncbi:MAG: nucleotidyl transferase AbiEii/AbiGii toxin family protein [Bacteroidota bacterium]|nr:nucleotidyl transferase AbiEii/AbiGii toxin family protein [Bacteroidota bacterium]
MLQPSAVKPGTLELLRQLQAIPELEKFFLVGGTALALRFGHRLSVDLDLFSTEKFENKYIINVLKRSFDNFEYRSESENVGIFCFINEIKVDFIQHYYYGLIDNIYSDSGVRMFGLKDIAAMKINAILKRAAKKDFYDLNELLNLYSITELIEYYFQKYPDQMLTISIPYAICYFDEAEHSENPVSLNKISWEIVKKNIQKKVREYLK